MKVRNFLFHRVSDEKDLLWPPITPSLFDRTIRAIVSKYQIVDLEIFLTEGVKARPNNRPVATILFDDGYKDNIEYAAPILKKYKCPASFYIVTDCINRNIPTWTYLIDYALQHTSISTLNLEIKGIPKELGRVSLVDRVTVARIKPWMKTLSNTRREQIMNQVLTQSHDVELPEKKMMSWNDIRQLQLAGFTIGSHSHTHPMLAALESEEEIENELSVSAQTIWDQLGSRPLTISYPIGSVDDRVTRLSEKTGYSFGLAVEQKVYDTKRSSKMLIPRIELYQESWWKVQLRLNKLFQRIKAL